MHIQHFRDEKQNSVTKQRKQAIVIALSNVSEHATLFYDDRNKVLLKRFVSEYKQMHNKSRSIYRKPGRNLNY